jgi:hypothetical protein
MGWQYLILIGIVIGILLTKAGEIYRKFLTMKSFHVVFDDEQEPKKIERIFERKELEK